MSSYNYEKALSLDWNGQLFVLTIRNEDPIAGSNYLYSNDGTKWFSSADLSNSPVITSKNPYNIKWMGSSYAMIGNLATSSGNTILKSRDGIKFSALPTNINGQIYDIESNLEFQNTVTFPKNTILALGGLSSDSTKIAYSNDEGVTWTPSYNSSQVFTTTVNSAVWTGKIWVALGSGGNTIGTSINGNTWIGQGSYIFTTAGYGVGWAKEQALIVAGGSGTNSLAYSYDGIFWVGLGNTLLSTVYDVQWNGSIWVAAGVPISGNKSIVYSYDGINWTLPQQTNLFDIVATKIGWNGSFFTVIGQSSSSNGSYNIATSSNGSNWKMQYNNSFVNSITNLYSNPLTNITMYSTIALSVFAPSKLIGTSATNNSISFSFTQPLKNVSNYTVLAIPTTGSTFTQIISSSLSSYTISNLPYTTSAISYTISVTANYADGSTATSYPITYSKLATVIPTIPSGLSYTGYTNTTISISWNPSTDTSITTYTIKAVDPNNNTITQTTSAPATTYTITGLTQTVTYTISISATNIAGTSNYSTTIYGTTADPYLTSTNMYCCFSVRLINPSYTGPIFNIRRSSDNVTQDFYTNSSQSYMTTGSGGTGTSYATWIGANYGYITKWYDQTGNGNHAINTSNNGTQPGLVANQTSNLITINYVVQWIRTNSTILTLTNSVTPYAIFSMFYNNNSSYGAILSGSGSNVLRFGNYGYNINGSNTSTDWYYSSSGTKLAYANGTNISSNYKLPANTSTWNYISLSAQNPAFSFNYIGRDPTNSTSNSINGYMLDMILYNQQMLESSMQKYYSNNLSLIPLITSPYYFVSLTYQPNTWRFTENKQKFFYSAYASGSWKLFVLTWNGYGYDNETTALSYIPAPVFVVNSDGTRIAILGATNQFQIYVSTFNGTTYSSPTASPQITTGSPYITFGYGTSVSMTPDGSKIIIGTDDQVTYIYYSLWDSTNSCYKSPVLISTTYTDFPSVDVTSDGTRIVATAYGVNYPITATWNGSTNYGAFSQFTTLADLQNGATRSLRISDNLSIIANTGSIVFANKNTGSYVVTTFTNFNFDQYYSPPVIFKDNTFFGYLSYSNPGYNYFVYLHKIS